MINLDNEPLAQDPFQRGIGENALYMGVGSERSLEFEQEVQASTHFYGLVERSVQANDDEVEGLEQQMDEIIKAADDPATVARMELAKMAALIKRKK